MIHMHIIIMIFVLQFFCWSTNCSSSVSSKMSDGSAAATVLSECQGSFCGRGLLSARKSVLGGIGNSSKGAVDS